MYPEAISPHIICWEERIIDIYWINAAVPNTQATSDWITIVKLVDTKTQVDATTVTYRLFLYLYIAHSPVLRCAFVAARKHS